jgi:hypothetical protein
MSNAANFEFFSGGPIIIAFEFRLCHGVDSFICEAGCFGWHLEMYQFCPLTAGLNKALVSLKLVSAVLVHQVFEGDSYVFILR